MFCYDSRPLNEDLEMMIQRRDANIFEERERSRMFAESVQNVKENERKKKKEREKFLENVKDTLMTEGIFYFVNESLPENATLQQRMQAEAAVYNFVKEENTDKMIRKYEETTEFLAEFCIAIQETFKEIMEETCEDPFCNYMIKQSSTDEFYGKLRKLDASQICKAIEKNVAKETEKFAQQQIEDKNRIEDLAQKTKEKIDNVKAKNLEDKEAIKQEMANAYKRQSQNIRYIRPRSLFEEMVYRITERSITDTSISENFCVSKDSNKPDIKAVIETVTVLYTVLEVLNVFKFKKFDAKSIESIVDNI